MSSYGTVTCAVEDGIATLTIDNPPVTGISAAVRTALLAQLRAAAADDAVRALVLVATGRCFLSGLDARELGRAPEGPPLTEVLAALGALDKPVVVAAHGAALGGGLETMLCCDYRAVSADVELGFPEIHYGLLPGAGGTQRTPRLVGAAPALELLTSGRRIGAQRALAMALVDEVFGTDIPPAVAGRAAARRWLDAGRGKRRVSTLSTAGGEDDDFEHAAARLLARTRGYRVPARVVTCVRAALTLPFDEGLVVEAREHAACEHDPQHAAMLHVFLGERRASHLPEAAADAAAGVRRVAVIGAGTMGRGIALACLNAGYSVLLTDREAADAARGASAIEALLERDVARGRIGEVEAGRRLGNLRTSGGLGELRAPDIVIEAVFEDAALKHDLFARLDRLLPAAGLLASNTSTLDIDAMAQATTRPARVLGLHFFSPAQLMPLVEIVAGRDTAVASLHLARDFVRRLGKVGVVVGNAFGFVGNRMLYAYGREVQLMLLEGAGPAQIDGVLQAFGMAMGPNAVGDLAGLDVGYRARRAWVDRPRDRRFYRVADALVEAGRLGQKTGRGIYRYEPGSRTPIPDPQVDALIAREAAALGIHRRAFGDEEILERALYALVLEGARLLEAGIARSASDVDVIWCNGYGFPRHVGGPMHYADAVGLPRIVAFADRRADVDPEGWQVPTLLRERVRLGQPLAGSGNAGARAG